MFSRSCLFKDDLSLYDDHISLISARLLLSLCATEPRLQASPYPLILSLENHCSVEQQTVMARHLRSILGDKLLTKPLDDISPLILPSPEVSRRLCSLMSFPFALQVYRHRLCLPALRLYLFLFLYYCFSSLLEA